VHKTARLLAAGYRKCKYTLCSKKSDAKIQITITTAYLTRIKYSLSGFNYHNTARLLATGWMYIYLRHRF